MNIDLQYVVYILKNTNNNKTYVGITNNIIRRLRQHNGELVGGAKYTKANKGDGLWFYYGFIKNLDKHLALSFEKKIKIKSRKMQGTPIEKRLRAVHIILNNTDYTFNQNIN
jgi:predicted GIY-YIG superfamily endonuclease